MARAGTGIGVWRQIAQRAIDAALDPFVEEWWDEASEYDVRNVLRAAYPFGPRANHPYRVWCQCVNEELRRRGYAPKDLPVEEPHFRLIHGVMQETGLSRRDWWLDLVCGYCTRAKVQTRGCLLCREKQDMLDHLVQSADWKRWITGVRDDHQTALIFADYLSDRGYDEVAELFRTTPPPDTTIEEKDVVP